MNDRQKIKIRRLIREVVKKEKTITTKIIQDYISAKEGKKITTLPNGKELNFSNAEAMVHQKIDAKKMLEEESSEQILIKQNEFLDDVISSASHMRIATYILSGITILIGIWIINWILTPSPSKHKNSSSRKQHTQKHIDIVSNSAWDSSVYQVENYLKRTLKDPDSYQSIEWWKVKKTSLGYKVLHKYRAKNSFGGYVTETAEFVLDSRGHIISVKKYK